MTKKTFDEIMKNKAWKEYEKRLEDKEKFRKKGPNVIHLEYLGPLFSENEFSEFENQINNVGLQFSRYDKSGVMYACLDKFELAMYLGITQPIIGELLSGIGTNAIWDAIKFLSVSIWKKTKNSFYNKLTSRDTEKKEVSFGLKVHLDRNTSFNFKLDGELDEGIIQNSLDKILNFLKDQKRNEKYKNSDYVYYDHTDDKWIKIDVEKEMRKMIKNGEINKK